MEQVYFETERLQVRQWSLLDIPALYGIMSNAMVHTYADDSAWSMERTEKYIRFMLDKDFRTMELFHGAVVLKESNRIIGRTGLNPYLEKRPEIEWKLGVHYWGKGYATEIGKAIIKNAFETTDISCIYGMARPDNLASRRVLEKIGMKCIGMHKFRDHDDMFYIVNKVY
ncbi:MAG TPA: GNAT family N-acetyltransferase [Lachnospiraceae bacterium]|nr:GNAT family N-acetyltransferase [Lachnospiraceae bacterium]